MPNLNLQGNTSLPPQHDINAPHRAAASSLQGQAPSTENSTENLISHWQAWVQEGDNTMGRREALRRLQWFVNSNDCRKELDLSQLNLHNTPMQWPEELTRLNLSRNAFRHLPENLPGALQYLDLSHNHLVEAPETVGTLNNNLRINLQHNPLNAQAQSSLAQMTNDPSYNGPILHWEANFAQTSDYARAVLNERFDNVVMGSSVAGSSPASATIDQVSGIAHWEAWAQQGKNTHDRHEALTRLKHCIANNETTLDFSGLTLHDLPAARWPDHIKKLVLNNCALTSLPAHWPKRLEALDLTNNRLDHRCQLPASVEYMSLAGNDLEFLPELPVNLVALRISYNRLNSLSNLPERLVILEVNHNRLSSLPNLPETLVILEVNHNRLRSLPNLPETLVCLDVSHNHLSRLPPLPNGLTRPGGRVETLGNPMNPLSSTPLTESIAQWTGNQPLIQQWTEVIQNQPSASDGNVSSKEDMLRFAAFLNRLHESNNAQSVEFKEAVVHFLQAMADDQELRTQLVDLCDSVRGAEDEDEFTSCTDGASRVFSQMVQTKHAYDIKRGTYDNQLGTAIELCFENCRAERLDVIARAFVDEQRSNRVSNIDEVEVFLALPIKLQKTLQLDHNPVKSMNFIRLDGLKKEDLVRAATTVFEMEGDVEQRKQDTVMRMPDTLLERLAPVGHSHSKMIEKIIEGYEQGDEKGKAFEKATRLAFFNNILEERGIEWPAKVIEPAKTKAQIRDCIYYGPVANLH